MRKYPLIKKGDEFGDLTALRDQGIGEKIIPCICNLCGEEVLIRIRELQAGTRTCCVKCNANKICEKICAKCGKIYYGKIKSRVCPECLEKAASERRAAYYDQNKDKLKEWRKDYAEKNRDKINRKRREYYNTKGKEYLRAHREEINRYVNKRYHENEEVKEKAISRARKWNIEHHEQYLKNCMKAYYRKKKRESIIRKRVCKQCGTEFDGGPRAWYCPACREERHKDQKARYAHRKLAGKAIIIGETVRKCEKCGREFIMMSARQRYCSACRDDAVKEVDRKQGLDCYEQNKSVENPVRNKKRREIAKCIVCGKRLQNAIGGRNTCSEACKKILISYQRAKSDFKRGRRKSLPSFMEWKEKQTNK